MKATNDRVTPQLLTHRAQGLAKAGYTKPKWIIFCEVLLKRGYTVELYETRRTVSKYITVKLDGFKPFKVRFSNHKPIPQRELEGDCDFFVGHTNLTITNTKQAFEAVTKHFEVQNDRQVG